MDSNELLPKIYSHISAVVHSAAREAVEQVLKMKSDEHSLMDQDFLSADQAAKFLKIKLNTIYSKVEKGELPYSRSGKRKLLFSKKDLEQYVANRKVKSYDEITDEVEAYVNSKK
jgi:excisionase family DNA binding protein